MRSPASFPITSCYTGEEPGNRGGVVDAAAARIMTGGQEAERRKQTPPAGVLCRARAGVDPERTRIGPVRAIRAALEKVGPKLAHTDPFEILVVAAAGIRGGLGIAMAVRRMG
jgi:acetyl-CoA acetyltransferase